MLLFSGELVRFLGADEELRGPAEAYLRGLMFFGPMIPCGLALSYFVRVNGKPALASVGLMLSALINIVLDAVFIPVFGMGVEGAAYATGIAYTITTGVLCLHFFTPEAKCRFTRAIGAWKEVGQACWNGVSELINETSIGLVILFINWILLARIGSYGVAAFTIINYAAWFGASVSYAISDSLSPLVSANFGARNFARARQFLGLALGMVFGIGLMLYGLFALYPEMLLKIFPPGVEKVGGGDAGVHRLVQAGFFVQRPEHGSGEFLHGAAYGCGVPLRWLSCAACFSRWASCGCCRNCSAMWVFT